MASFPWIQPVVTTPGSARGRCYLYHGINVDQSYWGGAPYSTLASGLNSDHWETVAVMEQYSGTSQEAISYRDATIDATKGARFRQEVGDLHAQTKGFIDATYGTAAGGKECLLGISWGGLMVELLAQSLRFSLTGWVAHLPITNPNTLSTGWTPTIDLSSLQPSAAIGGEPGWISWGTSDANGYTDTQTLAGTLHGLNSLVQQVSSAQIHETNAGNISAMLAFMAAL